MEELYHLAEQRSEAWKILLESRARALMPKDRDITELDRRVMMDGLCAEQEKEFMYLNSLYELKMRGIGYPGPSREDTGSALSVDRPAR